jgi:hypothetical protein
MASKIKYMIATKGLTKETNVSDFAFYISHRPLIAPKMPFVSIYN